MLFVILTNFVFLILVSQLRQQIYDLRSDFAGNAELAVEEFFSKYQVFQSKAVIQQYVEWAIPEPQKVVNKRGQIVWKEDQVFPYMYRFDGGCQMNSGDPLVS